MNCKIHKRYANFDFLEYLADETRGMWNNRKEMYALEVKIGHGCTVAFDSACFPGSLSLIIKPGLVCNAGRVVPMGFSDQPENFSQADINKRELDIIGSRMSAYQFEPVAENMAAGKYKLEGLVTTFVKFSEIEKVFENMTNPDPEVKKTVILFD